MRSGVSKSGSPAPNEMTSTPRARSALALAWTASVDDGASVFTRSASTVCGSFGGGPPGYLGGNFSASRFSTIGGRSEEHTSELQSLAYLVCRLLLEKTKQSIS